MSSSGFNPQDRISAEISTKIFALIDTYRTHLDGKKKIANPNQNGILLGEFPEEVKESELTRLKRAAIQGFLSANDGGTYERLADMLGRYESTLQKSRDYNPLPTHGGALVQGIRDLVPEIENTHGYLVGKAKSCFYDYTTARAQNAAATEEKALVSDDEAAVMKSCQTTVETNLYNNTIDYAARMQLLYHNQSQLTEPLNRVINANKKGFFAKVTSTFRATPEEQLLSDVNHIVSQYQALINKKVNNTANAL